MALLGGRLPVSEQIFIGLLGFSLLLAAAQMLIKPAFTLTQPGYTTLRYWLVAAPVGGLIGLLAGITGIGGGIFLAPVIYLFHLASARTVAGITSGFILVNSVAGLAGQMMKAGDHSPLQGWMDAWPLFVAVLIGGQLGSQSGAYHVLGRWIKRLTALLMLYVAARLIWRWAGLSFN